MKTTLSLGEILPSSGSEVGGKGLNLARMVQGGFAVPETLCITTAAYDAFLKTAGLGERIQMELNRKPFSRMRWEEIWDAALRIRNLFLITPMAPELSESLEKAVTEGFGERAVVVRSSAPGEDSGGSSFAGLHASFVNVSGQGEIIAHVRKVWASLWSDAALLYRLELGLDVQKSSMAVIVQEFVEGECSGVFFGRNPVADGQAVLEAVHGLNQGLVDGTVQPDRWLLDRRSGRILSHVPVDRSHKVATLSHGVGLGPLTKKLAQRAPLTPPGVRRIFGMAKEVERMFGYPLDMEWTLRDGKVVLLQARPITTGKRAEEGDQRAWYLSLHRSFENLQALRVRIEGEWVPEMIRDAENMAGTDLAALSDGELAAEIERRRQVNDHWVQVYWKEFIPFAHGVRLFGQVYNDAVRPEDPYEFMRLLERTPMKSLERNLLLEELAHMVKKDSHLAQRLSAGDYELADGAMRLGKIDQEKEEIQGFEGDSFQIRVAAFMARFGDLSCPVTGGGQCRQGAAGIVRIVLEMAAHAPETAVKPKRRDTGALENRYLSMFPEERRGWAKEVMALGRASYQLRDDDNIYLGRIEAGHAEAVRKGCERIEGGGAAMDPESREKLSHACGVDPAGEEAPDGDLKKAPVKEAAAAREVCEVATGPGDGIAYRSCARQLIGQPAGPGIATGRARVIRRHEDLMDFSHGEIMICDAVDPNMTFVVPLAAAVVERRGGMLIHGAIIAREYGIPCVTGVPDLTTLVETGDRVVVDGYLGIVTLSRTFTGRLPLSGVLNS